MAQPQSFVDEIEVVVETLAVTGTRGVLAAALNQPVALTGLHTGDLAAPAFGQRL